MSRAGSSRTEVSLGNRLLPFELFFGFGGRGFAELYKAAEKGEMFFLSCLLKL